MFILLIAHDIIIVSTYTVVTVGFEETTYFVLESNPSSVIVCVVLNGTTEREVEVSITAMDVSATSQSYYEAISHIKCYYFCIIQCSW